MPLHQRETRLENRRRRGGWALTMVTAGAMALLLFWSGVSLSTEWRVKRLTDRYVKASQADPASGMAPYVMAAAAMSAREQLLSASIIAADAAGQTGELRRRALARADDLLGRALESRPGWAQAHIMRAYVRGLVHGGVNSQSTTLIEASYSAAPFLEAQADWRLRYVVAAWRGASGPLRRSAVNEAIWMSTESAAMYLHVKLLLEGTPAYQPFLDERRYLQRSDQLTPRG